MAGAASPSARLPAAVAEEFESSEFYIDESLPASLDERQVTHPVCRHCSRNSVYFIGKDDNHSLLEMHYDELEINAEKKIFGFYCTQKVEQYRGYLCGK